MAIATTKLIRTVAGLAVVTLSLTVSFLLFEAGIRVYSGLFFPKMMVLDEKLGWRHAANASKTFENELGENVLVVQNSRGHRGAVRNQTDGSVFRILALGDSFTEGVQVGEEDLFTARMEKGDPRLEVLNAGVGGYGTFQEYLYLASEGLELQPDFVLLMFYENDLTDNGLSYYPGLGPRPYARLQGDRVEFIEALDASEYQKFILPIFFRMAFNNYSHFYYFVNSRVYQPIFASRMLALQKADLQKLSAETRYKLFYSTLQRFQDLLSERNIPFAVVLIPSREDVAQGTSNLISEIERHCAEHQIDCLSLLDRFSNEAAAGAGLYFDVDMHWTKEGHKVAADEILMQVRHISPRDSVLRY